MDEVWVCFVVEFIIINNQHNHLHVNGNIYADGLIFRED